MGAGDCGSWGWDEVLMELGVLMGVVDSVEPLECMI